jgi:hypothetical protein
MRPGIVLLALLAGCAVQKETYLPDGRKGYTITCNGTLMDWSLCYTKAGETCKERGYDVIEKNDSDAVSAGPFMATGGTYGRTLLIACK